MGAAELQLPPDLPNWRVVKEALRELRGKLVNKTTNPQEVGWFMQVIYNTIQSDQCSPGNVSSQLSLLKAKVQAKLKQKLDNTCLWYGVVKFLKKVPAEEKEQFMNATFPSIIEFALRIEEFMKRESVVRSKQQTGGKIVLSRKFVCSIVACFFLCLFPERKRHGKQPVNIVNFTAFFKNLPIATQIAKLRCVLHYFECVIQRNMEVEGSITFHRKVAPSNWLLDFSRLGECGLTLCPLKVMTDGRIEDSGREVMQICFGNKSLGGGALGKSRVQEEIKFCTCPELMAAMLMMENMEDNEAIEISGFEQVSCYRGYAESFQFDGHCNGAFVDPGRNFMVTMDATSYRGKEPIKQYEEEYVLRDLNKALIGFCDVASDQINVTSSGKTGAEEVKPQEMEIVTSKRKVSASKKSDAIKSATSSWPHHKFESVGSLAMLEKEKTRVKSDLGERHYVSCETQPLPSEGNENLLQLYNQTHPPPPPPSPPPPPTTTPPPRQPSSTAATFPVPSLACQEDYGYLQQHFLEDVESPTSVPSYSFMVPTGPPGATRIPSPDDVSPHPLSSMASSSPVPIPPSSRSGNEAAALAVAASSPTWPRSHSPFHSFLAADSPPTCSIHSSVQLPADCANLDLPADDFSLQADSTVGIDSNSQVDSEQCQSSFPSALSPDPTLLLSGSKDGGPPPPPAKYYSDVLGNLTTASSGAHVTCTSPPTYPLTLFHPADPTEIDYNCCHSSKQLSSSSATPLKSKRERIFKQSAHSSFELEPRASSHSMRGQEVEKAGSDISNYSIMVCVDSQSASVHSLDDCSSIATSPGGQEGLMRMGDASFLDDSFSALASKSSGSKMSSLSAGKNAQTPGHHIVSSHSDAGLLEPPRSSSPHSSGSSLNHSANSSFGIQDATAAKVFSSQLVEEFFSPCDLANPQNGTRDFHSEVREWISASSSSSVVPAPSSSSSEGCRWGSRSGSLSSHGTSGSHHDVGEVWPSQRRRSSQMSDASRRSSSSKHSSDLGTDLEEISESLAKQGHTVIEEEGSQLALNVDFDDMDTAELEQPKESVDEQTGLSLKHRTTDHENEEPEAQEACSGLPLDYTVENRTGTDNVDPSSCNLPPKLEESGAENDASAIELQPSSQKDNQLSIPFSGSPDTVLCVEGSGSTEGGEDLLNSGETAALDPVVSGVHGEDVIEMALSKESTGLRNMVSAPVHEPVSWDLNEEKVIADTSYITLPSKTIVFEAGENQICSENVQKSVLGDEDLRGGSSEQSRVDSDLLTTSSHPVPSLNVQRDYPATTEDIVLGPESDIKAIPNVAQYDVSQDISKQPLSEGQKSEMKTSERDMHATASRYLFSDVASAPADQSNFEYRAISPLPETGRNHPPNFNKAEISYKNVKSTQVTTPLMSLFISNLAKMALKEACNEGAKITSDQTLKTGEEKEIISDEIYTFFATDIVNQVFVHVLSSIESRDVQNSLPSLSLDFQSGEEASSEDSRPWFQKPLLEGEQNPLSSLSSPATPSNISSGYLSLTHPKSTTDLSSQQVMPSLPQSAVSRSAPSLAPANSKPSSQKPKNSSALNTKALGICKTVSFEDSCTESRSNADSPVAGLAQQSEIKIPGSGSTSSVFQRPSSSSSSFSKESGAPAGPQPSHDATKQSSVISPSVPRLCHSQSALELSRRYSLTTSDYDIHQTATAIVNQVFQSISDSLGKDSSLAGIAGLSDATDSGFSTTVNNYRWGQTEGFVSNIFSSSPAKSHSSSRYSSHSPSLGIVSRKPMSREGLTNAYLKVDSTPSVKTYERRCSEPCHTSVQLSLQAFNDNRYNCKQSEEKQAKLSCTDDEIHQGRTWRRGSLDGFTFERRRNSCGFKDPVLSRFAEELMKADTSVPELLLFGSHQSSSTTGSRRSSISGFKDTTLANLESELLNTSFTSICSLSLSQSPRSQHRQSRASLRSRSWELRQGKSDSSDTEHLFPLPRYVGDEFLQEYRKQYGYEDDEKDLSGSVNSLLISKPVLQIFQSDPDLQTEEERLMEKFATNLSSHILLEAFSCHQYEGQAMPCTSEDAVHPGEERIDSEVVAGNLSIGGTDDSSSVYFGEGARPKISAEARTPSKARPIPQRKSEDHSYAYSGSSDGFGYNSVSSDCLAHSSGHRRAPRSSSTDAKERHSFIPLFKRLMSQEKPQKASQDSISSSSAPVLIPSSSSLPVVTAPSSLSRVHRRHLLSKSASVQLSGSSSDITSSSTTSIPKAVRREEKRRRASSETPYSYRAAGLKSSSKAERAHLQTALKLQPLQYEFSHDDSVDSIVSSCSDSSAHSGQTRSSVLSSSLSDSEGSKPRSNGNKPKASQAERKKRMVVRQAAIIKESSKGTPSTASQGRARRERGRKRSLTKPRPKRDSRDVAYQFLNPKEDAFADSLSRTIVSEALKDFTQLKWKLYVSYNRTIATGNWGCGAFRGNAQLKLVLQWIAASVAKAPSLLYYTFGDNRLSQAKDVVHELSSWTIGELSVALQDYCNWARCHMSDPDTCASSSTSSWIYGLLHLKIGCGRQPSGEVNQDEALPISLFDYLLNFHRNKDEEH